MDDSTISIPLFSPVSGDRPSAIRPDYIEKIRAEARGEVYRPAARKKGEPAELAPFTVSRLFTIENPKNPLKITW